MIRQGAELIAAGSDVTERATVCVIGSGCGGATIAKALAEKGLDVLIVEQGGYYTYKDFDQREANMLAKIDGGRGLDTSVDMSVQLTYGNNVGGASVHYWADSYRVPPDRIAFWEERYGLQGHGDATLQPHYERIERDHHVTPAEDPYVNTMNQLVRDAATKLGWQGAPVPQARLNCNRSGHCMQGCAYNAKQSQIVTHVPRALELGARLYADTRAEHLVMDGRAAKGLRCAVVDRGTGLPTGLSVNVEASAIVVACGGFETPAFLLRQDFADTLPHLGRHFFCNPSVMMHAVFEQEIIQWRNIPAAWGVEQFRLSRHDRSLGTEVTPLFGEQGTYVEGGYLLMANQLHPGMLATVLPGLGRDHRRLMRSLPRLGGTIAWIDDAEEGRISVEGGRRRIDVPLTGGNGRRIRDAWRKGARLLVAAGAKELIFGDAADTRVKTADLGADPDASLDALVDAIDLRPARNVFAVPHPGGGTRMGKGPEDSVVDFEHRVHGTDNVYVADPSVFPTGPSVDPSEAIMAFSYVAAEHIAQAVG